ncbi:PIN domain nuclease [bacterium]|nr:PIN domain nuclease [bacterium]MBU1064362.1 PIN domain nuclease [bacterium]MBU1634114.1 PIN domain nuclease [bacterium]MBU1873606.1 PIN domain nuclease [bacterium]
MILVDTSVWIDYFNGAPSVATDILDTFLGKESIIMGDIIYTEVLQGFKKDRDFQTARDLLDQFPFCEMIGKTIALQSAVNYRILRKQGISIRKTVDVIIATFCMVRGFRLLHSDRDFDPIEKNLGLVCVH